MSSTYQVKLSKDTALLNCTTAMQGNICLILCIILYMDTSCMTNAGGRVYMHTTTLSTLSHLLCQGIKLKPHTCILLPGFKLGLRLSPYFWEGLLMPIRAARLVSSLLRVFTLGITFTSNQACRYHWHKTDSYALQM